MKWALVAVGGAVVVAGGVIALLLVDWRKPSPEVEKARKAEDDFRLAQSPSEKELEPISLIEEETPAPAGAPHHAPAPGAPPPSKKILAFGGDVTHKKHDWKRQPFKSGTGAIRVKSFHGKYSEQGLEYLDNAINEWLDANPEIEVKFVTPTVMVFEGKIRENALVLNVWY